MRDSNAPSILSRVLEWTLASVIVLSWSQSAYGQSLSVTGGLGLEYFNSPSISRYLIYEIGGVFPGTYTSAVQFVVGGDYRIASNWEVGLEYGYITRSVAGSNNINISYSYSLPSVVVLRVFRGDGFYIRYGAGIGYHFGSLGVTSPYSTAATNYSAKGIGFNAEAAFDTELDQNFYARITAEARGEFVGNLKTGKGDALTYTAYNGTADQSEPVNMNFAGVGLTFGLVYYF